MENTPIEECENWLSVSQYMHDFYDLYGLHIWLSVGRHQHPDREDC